MSRTLATVCMARPAPVSAMSRSSRRQESKSGPRATQYEVVCSSISGRWILPQPRFSWVSRRSFLYSVAMVETRGVTTHNAVFAGFRPEGEKAKDAPIRLFIERSTGSGPIVDQAFLPDQTGFLVENGLPDLALREFETRGIRLASPHYVLRTSAGARRDTYYIVAAVAGFLGFVCLLVAGIMAIQGRALLRRA